MAKNEYEKFKAIQLNNEEIAQKDFAGMRRTADGWSLPSPAANAVLGSSPLIKSGSTGAKILDTAASEPTPTTAGQAILKSAGQWAPLNAHYANSGVAATNIADGETAKTEPTVSEPVATTKANKTTTVQGTKNSGMTLGEYIKSLGQNPNAAYRQSVAAANAQYDRQRSTYGAEAEALAGQGLGTSGTSDYLDAQAYAEKQRAISQAAATRDATTAALAAQYGEYQQNERALKESKIQTALDRAVSMQLNEANTVKYLMAMTGLTKSEAEQYASGAMALTNNAETEAAERTAKLQEITSLYEKLTTSAEDGGKGMSDAAARAYLKGAVMGYDAELVDIAANEMTAASEQTKADQIAQTQQTVTDTFEKVLTTYSGEDAQKVLAELGINVQLDDEGYLDIRETREAITAAVNNQLINSDQYLVLMKSLADNAISGSVEDKNLYTALQVAEDLKTDKQVQEYALDKIYSSMKNITGTNEENPLNGSFEFECNFNGETHEIEFETDTDVDSKTEKSLNQLYPNPKKNQLVVINGTIYVFGVESGEGGRWCKVTNELDWWGESASDEQAKLLYKIIAKHLGTMKNASKGAVKGVLK